MKEKEDKLAFGTFFHSLRENVSSFCFYIVLLCPAWWGSHTVCNIWGIISSVSPPQPSKDSRWFPALVVSRVIFVPLLVMCNVQDRNYTPVLFSNDLMFAAIMVFFSVSSGYFVCLSMTYAPQ